MGYPYTNNPLDTYLMELRELRLKEVLAYADLNNTQSNRIQALEQFQEVRKSISEVYKRQSIPSRSFDIFRSAPELAVQKFELENPEPESFAGCKHQKTELRMRTFRDGSLHTVSQCCNCGSQTRSHAKPENWESLPKFDELFLQTNQGTHSLWFSERWRTYHEAMREGHEAPEFSYTMFYQKYSEESPPPLSDSNCEHYVIETRLRTYKSGADAVVEQCVLCGKHVAGIAKKKVDNWKNLPPFDEELETKADKDYSAWLHTRSKEAELAKAIFHAEINEKIRSGEIATKDNSTFGTYYTSEEWRRTRARIFARDHHTCQACAAQAECVHHIVYDRLGQENNLDLISLCNNCHDEIHARQRKHRAFSFRLTPSEIKNLWQNPKGTE